MLYRHKVVDYMRAHKDEYQCLYENEQELEDNIRMIERSHWWGGELEMSILSKLYKCAFVIHATGRPEITVSLPIEE